jgi:hypothetical protein
MRDALEALEVEREQKYELKKKLDEKMNHDVIRNMNSFGLRFPELSSGFHQSGKHGPTLLNVTLFRNEAGDHVQDRFDWHDYHDQPLDYKSNLSLWSDDSVDTYVDIVCIADQLRSRGQPLSFQGALSPTNRLTATRSDYSDLSLTLLHETDHGDRISAAYADDEDVDNDDVMMVMVDDLLSNDDHKPSPKSRRCSSKSLKSCSNHPIRSFLFDCLLDIFLP